MRRWLLRGFRIVLSRELAPQLAYESTDSPWVAARGVFPAVYTETDVFPGQFGVSRIDNHVYVAEGLGEAVGVGPLGLHDLL